MSLSQPSSSGAFNKLPIELNKEIALYLDSDKDICAFRLICRGTNDAIDGDQLNFWRNRFKEAFAVKDDRVANKVLQKEYQIRKKYLKRGATEDFRERGHSSFERKLIQVLRSLVVESYRSGHGYDAEGRPRCPNQLQLLQFIKNSRAFLCVQPLPSSGQSPSAELTAMQIVGAQLLLEQPSMRYDILSFDDSQKLVYATHKTEPMFTGRGDLQVNMNWTLHCINFFRHHMVKQEAGTLFRTMTELHPFDRPSAWRDPLQEGSYPLSKHWKGTFSYLDNKELARIRGLVVSNTNGRQEQEIFEDKNIENGGNIQEMELSFTDGKELHWPKEFEDRLQSQRPTMGPQTRAQRRATKRPDVAIRVQGGGIDAGDEFFASGWLNPLAPQQSIPGWQRITFMKHFNPDLLHMHNDELWAYEGVVVPGGRLIVGRWWWASGEPTDHNYGDYSGPFILWAVDSPPDYSTVDDRLSPC